MLQLAVLPPLIFAELFHTDIYMFRKVMGQALVLAFPGVLLSALLMCIFIVYLLPQYFDWSTGMMFGAMLAASDPVAVLAGMKQLGADPRLTTIISGESIMNDGCAVVLFTLFYGVAFEAKSFSARAVVKFTAMQTLGAMALGLCFLFGAFLVLKLCRKEMSVVLTIIITVPFMCFYAATLVDTSGILSLIPLSLGLRLFSRNFLWGELDEASHTVWELIEFMANTFVFLISGVIMVVDLMSSKITGADVLDLLYIYLASLAVRGVTVLAFYPLLKRMGLGFNAADALVTWWGGLKGAVGLSIAMIVHFTANKGHPLEKTGVRFMFHMGGVYFLTTVINATLSSHLVQYLKLDAKPGARMLAMLAVSDECCQHVAALAHRSKAVESAAKVREISERYRQTAQNAMKANCDNATCLGDSLLEAGSCQVDLEGERRRVLEICTKRYRAYFEAGMISRPACAALDHVTKDAAFACGTQLQQWGALGRLCAGLLHCSRCSLGLGAFFMNLSAEIAWGFAEAQKSVRKTLPDVPILGEVDDEQAGASAFLESLRREHPGVLRQLQARHLAATARSDALGKIHQAVEQGVLHADEAAALEEMADHLSESLLERA
eukprot:TRINITY_DN108421_c0_g1_i1.p1 TRINITY_DN108421_c0_g1~~TRINITY_DN108421_c0_g1_i1.p1  ORF type:complete len:715 (-),score=130.41 TRINITY_DN108421_c0_g1_i1:20-1843(-)